MASISAPVPPIEPTARVVYVCSSTVEPCRLSAISSASSASFAAVTALSASLAVVTAPSSTVVVASGCASSQLSTAVWISPPSSSNAPSWLMASPFPSLAPPRIVGDMSGTSCRMIPSAASAASVARSAAASASAIASNMPLS